MTLVRVDTLIDIIYNTYMHRMPGQGSMPKRIRDFLNIFGSSTVPVTDTAIAQDDTTTLKEQAAESSKTALTYRDFLEKLRYIAYICDISSLYFTIYISC